MKNKALDLADRIDICAIDHVLNKQASQMLRVLDAKVKLLTEALNHISERCTTNHEYYTCASVGDKARSALAAANNTEFSYAPRGITE